ncbi:MAG: 50S ribosomal protein L13 [Gemmatimonadota bacterium]|uniref:50S ribosomal protein L13 n=1 Tax=Candidatus Palauibacter scopulicola TaxID=3056741 RepID=UPI00239DAA13|nr:50S ribosomal protein L13 [Candidatus Palauibacter scopulicola]MDE2661565.1 50S ribosomal protein L13 [Candidatus Palauibacter scopulicola]
MKTYSVKAGEIERDWYVVDAADQVLGRLATRIATVLRGKHKPIYSTHLDTGDYVVVVNAERVRLTGNKADQKEYFRHSGYMGGERFIPFRRMLDRHPDRVIKLAVKGMLPKNTLGRQMLGKLRVYAGPEHPHAPQHPRPFDTIPE